MWQQILKKDMSYCVCSGPNKTKGFTCKAHCRSKEMRKNDPKKGTGKKPKGSGRRLYTDEDPSDTISLKYATPKDARDSVRKILNLYKSGRVTYARAMQYLTVGEQRSKYSKTPKPEQVEIFGNGKEELRELKEDEESEEN